MKKNKKLITSLALSAIMAVQPIACYAVDEETETYSYTFDAYVVDMDNNNALVGGLEARLVEYKFDIDSEYCQAGEKLRTLAEWTTSDTEHEYITCEDVRTDCVYILEIDELPENYNFQGDGYVARHHFGDSLYKLTYNPYWIWLDNEPPYEIWEDFPITKTVDWKVYYYDYTKYIVEDAENPIIQGMDVEIVRINLDEDGNFSVGDLIGKYNTSDGDSIIRFTTEETFNSEQDEVYFGFKLDNVPAGYEKAVAYLYDENYDNHSCDGYYIESCNGYSVRTRSAYFYHNWRKVDDEYITTMPTITTTTTSTMDIPFTTTTTTVNNPSLTVAGDANGDNQLSIADAVLIMQALSNPDEFVITPECAELADVVNKGDGITPLDALAIQMINIDLLNESDLPVTSEELISFMN